MSEPTHAVTGPHDITSSASDSPKGGPVPWSAGANVFLHERPGGFNRVEVVRVRGQIADAGPPPLDGGADGRLRVGFEIVEQHDVPRTQARHQRAPHPPQERGAGHRLPLRPERDPSRATDGADQRQVIAPVHRPHLDVFASPQHPCVRPPHRQIGARFIEKHQAVRIDPAYPPHERAAFRLDVRPINLARPRPFFFCTYP
jgi:hypothetical protein